MPEQNLKAALLPLDIKYCDPETNLRVASQMFRSLDADTDLAILPEMFTSAFTTDTDMLEYISEAGACVPEVIKGLAEELDMCICGSYITKSGQKFLNRGFICLPDGRFEIYDKHHLFRAGGEGEIFTAGRQQSPTVNFRSWNLKMAICYDIRFPVWNRNKGLEYDVLIVPACWPEARRYAWSHLLIARAIENQAYVLGADRSGTDPYGEYSPEASVILDHWGKDVSQHDAESGIVYGTLDAERIVRDRKRFSPWKDADDFTID